jgi:hypothetical protein
VKKKDIITLSIATILIIASLYFAYTLLFPAPKPAATTQKKKEQTTIPAEIDSKTFQTVSTLSDYGKPNLDGIGKNDLFAGF